MVHRHIHVRTYIDNKPYSTMVHRHIHVRTYIDNKPYPTVQWFTETYMYVYIYIRRGKNKNLTALKSNSNTVWFNFQTYIIFSILVSFKVTLRSSGTDILYGCHLLLDVCIIYFISCDCIVNNSSLSYPIY